MKKPLRRLFVAFAGTMALGTAAAVETYKAEPVALLATGTNGGDDVYGETAAMIDRLQDDGYLVDVVPPRHATARQNTVHRDLRPLRAAVLRAAREERLQVIDPQTWYPDGFHIARAEAVAIGQRG